MNLVALCLILCQMTLGAIAQADDDRPMNVPFLECGDDENDMVNVTYQGEQIDVMYPIDHDLECASEPMSHIEHVIFDVNHRDCGMRYKNDSDMWSIDILVQKLGDLVTVGDRTYHLMCVFGSWVSESKKANVTFKYNRYRDTQQSDEIVNPRIAVDPAGVKQTIVDTMVEFMKDSYHFNLRVLGEGGLVTPNIYRGQNISLLVEFSSPMVTSYSHPSAIECCIRSHSTNKSHKSFEDKFYIGGCGNGPLVDNTKGFEPDLNSTTSNLKSRSPTITVPAKWVQTEKVMFVCMVAACHIDLLCENACPLDVDQFDLEPDRTAKAEVYSSLLIVGTDDVLHPKIFHTLDTHKTTIMWDGGQWIILNWPYIVVVGGLIIILLFFACIMLCVVKAAAHCNQCHRCRRCEACSHSAMKKSKSVSFSKNLIESPSSRQSRADSGIEEGYLADESETREKSSLQNPLFPQKKGQHVLKIDVATSCDTPVKEIPIYAKIPIAVQTKSLSEELEETLIERKLGKKGVRKVRSMSDSGLQSAIASTSTAPPLTDDGQETDYRSVGTNVPEAPPLPPEGLRTKFRRTQSERTHQSSDATQTDDIRISDISGRYFTNYVR